MVAQHIIDTLWTSGMKITNPQNISVTFNLEGGGIGHLNSAQMQTVLSAMDEITKVANVKFSVGSNGGGPSATIAIVNTPNIELNGAQALTTVAPSGNTINAAFIGFGSKILGAPASALKLVAMHELLHAIAQFRDVTPWLKDHPNANFVNTQDATIMSYNSGTYTRHVTPDSPSNPATGLQTYDIAVLQSIYGANHTYNSGNDTYDLTAITAKGYTFWDGAGTDTIDASSITTNGANTLSLNEGYANISVLHSTSGGDRAFWIAEGANIENLSGTQQSDTMLGNSMDNNLSGRGGNDTLYGGDGNDAMDAGNGDDELYGETGNDLMKGNLGIDYMRGGKGDDSMYGYGAYNFDDTDADTLYGDDGFDLMYGGGGNDYLNGGNEDDTLYGGNGDDYLNGAKGLDLVYGEAGNDTVIGGSYGDTLDGGAGNDSLDGTDGSDEIYGSSGNDTLNGGTGTYNDYLNGGSGADSLLGSTGNDTLYGSTGNDTLYGAAGADYFYFSASGNADLLRDFQDGVDKIWLDTSLGLNASNIASHLRTEKLGGVTVVNGQFVPGPVTYNAILTFENSSHQVTIEGIQASFLTSSDFIFG